MKPGLAFIPDHGPGRCRLTPQLVDAIRVGLMIWKPATVSTIAGWVRPHRSGLAEAAQPSYISCADDGN